MLNFESEISPGYTDTPEFSIAQFRSSNATEKKTQKYSVNEFYSEFFYR